MHLPRFLMERPESFEEAATLLKVQGGSCLVAGGTELFPRMKYGLCSPEIIVSLKGLKASEPRVTEEGMLVLDPKMSLTALVENSEIRYRAPLLAMAAGRVASREIRNMGTLGGNLCQDTRCLYYNQGHAFQFREPCFKRGGDLCHFIPNGKKCWAVFMSDLAPALFCLDASVNIVGSGGVRQIKIDALYERDPIKPVSLNRDEIITRILVPKCEGPSGSGFAKFTMRGGVEFAGVNVAVSLKFDKDSGTCKKARVAVGAVLSGPQRVPEAEALLEGKNPSDGVIRESALKAAESVTIVPHHGYSKGYLAECLKVQAKAALSDAKNSVKDASK